MSIMWGIEIAQLYMWLLSLIARLWPLRQAKFHTLGWPNVRAPQPILVLCWLEKISAESNEQQQQQQNRMKNWFKGRNNNSNFICCAKSTTAATSICHNRYWQWKKKYVSRNRTKKKYNEIYLDTPTKYELMPTTTTTKSDIATVIFALTFIYDRAREREKQKNKQTFVVTHMHIIIMMKPYVQWIL